MKPQLVVLYTRDHNFDRVLSEALSGTGAVILTARSLGGALQIVCRRGRELDLAVMDFNDGSHGMTLLSALNTCYDKLPTLVASSKDTEYASALAYTNGARVCLSKPFSSAMLAKAISYLHPTDAQLAVA